MKTTQRTCPTCGGLLAEGDGFFVCAEHGKWYSYSANLLVRAPSVEAQAPERVLMPWERLVPAI